MRLILLLLTSVAVFALPAAAAAQPQSHAVPGFFVVHDASADGGVKGRPVATVVVSGFVLGHITHEGAVKIYPLNSDASALAGQATGVTVTQHAVTYHSHGVDVPGTEFSGSDFRFRAVGGPGGAWRVVVYGAGVSLYAGGEGSVWVHGSVAYPNDDGVYSLDDGPFASLPAGVYTQRLGTK